MSECWKKKLLGQGSGRKIVEVRRLAVLAEGEPRSASIGGRRPPEQSL